MVDGVKEGRNLPSNIVEVIEPGELPESATLGNFEISCLT